jgi:SAM-dependent methyltransferase
MRDTIETKTAQRPLAESFFEELFPALKAAWGEDIPDLYQFDNIRARTVAEHLDFLSGCRVLDVGCNSGIYSLMLGSIAPYVHGIDINEPFIRLAQIAKNHFQRNVHDMSHVTFEQTGFYNFKPAKHAFDAVLACNVLYHLGDEEIKILEQILKGCRKAMFQMRPRRQMAYEKAKEKFFYVSRNSVCGGLYTVGHAVDFLQGLGFNHFQIRGEENYWEAIDEPFPVVLASRV